MNCNDFPDTYKDGLKGLDRLKREDNILTCDSEDNTSKVQEKMIQALRQKELQKKVDILKERFDASTLESSTLQSNNMAKGIHDKTNKSEGLLIFI